MYTLHPAHIELQLTPAGPLHTRAARTSAAARNSTAAPKSAHSHIPSGDPFDDRCYLFVCERIGSVGCRSKADKIIEEQLAVSARFDRR